MAQTEIDPATLEAVVAQMPDALVVCNDSGAVVMLNPLAERMLACDRAALIGTRLDTLVVPPGEGSQSPVTGRCRRPDGTELAVEIAASWVSTPAGRLEVCSLREAHAGAPGGPAEASARAQAGPGRANACKLVTAPAPAPDGVRVLLVEDDPAVCRIATRLLSRNGFVVTTATSGAEALEALAGAEAPVELLLTDVMMPEMTGPELATRARAAAPDLPVVFMSGHVTPLVDPSAIPDAGLVLKPFTEASLIRALQAALDASGAVLPTPR